MEFWGLLLGLAVTPQDRCPRSKSLKGATETFGVCSQAQTLFYRFNIINAFHCLLSLHYSSILSFHFVNERLASQRVAVTGPKVL